MSVCDHIKRAYTYTEVRESVCVLCSHTKRARTERERKGEGDYRAHKTSTLTNQSRGGVSVRSCIKRELTYTGEILCVITQNTTHTLRERGNVSDRAH